MTTLQDAHKVNAAYFGDRGKWHIIATTHRDADILTRANYAAICEWARGEGIEVEHEQSGHWAVGWVEYAVVAPEHGAIVETIRERLEDYPVFDDDTYSDLETRGIMESVAQAVTDWWSTNGEGDLNLDLVHAVQNAAFDADGSDSPYYSGVDDYWPSDEFIAGVYATL